MRSRTVLAVALVVVASSVVVLTASASAGAATGPNGFLTVTPSSGLSPGGTLSATGPASGTPTLSLAVTGLSGSWSVGTCPRNTPPAPSTVYPPVTVGDCNFEGWFGSGSSNSATITLLPFVCGQGAVQQFGGAPYGGPNGAVALGLWLHSDGFEPTTPLRDYVELSYSCGAQPPTISKSFGNPTIALGASTSLTFTLANTTASPLTGAAFTDALPSGLAVASPNGLSNACGGSVNAIAGSGSIALTGGTVPASSNCLVTVNVRGTTAGVKNNATSVLTTDQGSSAAGATASLTVVGTSTLPPTLTKEFVPSTVRVGTVTRITFRLTNPNPTTPLSRITFADPFPSGVAVASTPSVANTCGGVPSVGPFALAVAFANGTLPAAGSCTFSVNVTATSIGVKNNTTTIVSSSAGAGSPASATLTVNP